MNSKDFSEWGCKEREKETYTLGNSDIRRWYQRDIDQITHSTCFRKLQRKSQLLSEKDPRSRSRLIHTIEVSRIAMEISEKLGLSKELTEAICLAHDIGTSPYGYIGNSFLEKYAKQPFSHEAAGVYMLLGISQKRIMDEKWGPVIEAQIEESTMEFPAQVDIDEFPKKLYASKIETGDSEAQYFLHHISPEIIDGVLNHGDLGKPNTLEGQVVKFADNIAYLSQDIEDLISTHLVKKTQYSKHSANKILKYMKKVSAEDEAKTKEISMSWNTIDQDGAILSLKDAFSETRGKRIAAFVGRFVDYNLRQLQKEELDYRRSYILNKEIPVLKCDEGMQFVIDYIWNFIEQNYEMPLIKTSNSLQLEKMSQLWEIISSKDFTSRNASFKNFIDMISSNSLFQKYEIEWKKAFFISHLSWFDVDLIIDSYHERNNTFELDISY